MFTKTELSLVEELRQAVITVRNEVENLVEELDYLDESEESSKKETPAIWIGKQLNIEAIIKTPEGDWLGAEVLVCSGGPTIRVCTRDKTVTGWWGDDVISYCFRSELLDDFLMQVYG